MVPALFGRDGDLTIAGEQGQISECGAHPEGSARRMRQCGRFTATMTRQSAGIVLASRVMTAGRLTEAGGISHDHNALPRRSRRSPAVPRWQDADVAPAASSPRGRWTEDRDSRVIGRRVLG